MLRSFKIALAIGVALLGSVFAPADAKAGWGHWGHHHGWGGGYGGGWGYGGWGHHHYGNYGGGLASVYGLPYYGGSWGGYGWPSYGWGSSYTSLSIGLGPAWWGGYSYDYPRRYPYIYPGSLSSYDTFYYPGIASYPVSSYSYQPYYGSSYYAPYASVYGSASNCCAPVVASACCDPCAGVPVDSGVPATAAPRYDTPEAAPAAPAEPASAEAAPSVRALPNWIPSSSLTRAEQESGVADGSLLTAAGRGSVQSVSLAKPVAPEIATDLVPLSKTLLQAADAIFAAGDYQQAAAAYARLTLRYGNHDELAVRRFIALVASGDCEQAAVMFEAASLSEQSLLASALPAGGLAELYGATASQRETHVDYLAAYALRHPDDGLALAMVGTWLELDGQTERAQLFMQRAAVLAPSDQEPGEAAPSERQPSDQLPVNSAHLVANAVSQ